ncbi:MAG: histidinol dehydrogenase, partial [Cyanobacteria bacterium]|nr:histidinol dehydrogenase [Cyanobacteriota bacterium]
NQIAPEHLQVNIQHPESIQHQLKNFGGMFLGYGATVPFGDYMAGPNHTLPTGRTARFTGGLNPLTFLRPQSWIQVDTRKIQGLAQETADFANLEGLKGHAAAALERIKIN